MTLHFDDVCIYDFLSISPPLARQSWRGLLKALTHKHADVCLAKDFPCSMLPPTTRRSNLWKDVIVEAPMSLALDALDKTGQKLGFGAGSGEIETGYVHNFVGYVHGIDTCKETGRRIQFCLSLNHVQ
jgi:hypothetical protein